MAEVNWVYMWKYSLWFKFTLHLHTTFLSKKVQVDKYVKLKLRGISFFTLKNSNSQPTKFCERRQFFKHRNEPLDMNQIILQQRKYTLCESVLRFII